MLLKKFDSNARHLSGGLFKIKLPVTIIIGLKCVDCIIMGCDSRTTLPDGHVDDDVKKLHTIDFQDGNSAIIGESGHAEFSSRVIEMIKNKAKSRSFKDYRVVADCAQESIAELKKQIREQYAGSAEELHRHFEAHSFELIISHYWQKQAQFFTVLFEHGIPIKRDKNYYAIGCGTILADFLFSALDIRNYRSAHGMWNVVYAVEEIKKTDSRCGGRTRTALIYDHPFESHAQLCPDDDKGMAEAIKEALAFSVEFKPQWNQIVAKRIQKIAATK